MMDERDDQFRSHPTSTELTEQSALLARIATPHFSASQPGGRTQGEDVFARFALGRGRKSQQLSLGG